MSPSCYVVTLIGGTCGGSNEVLAALIIAGIGTYVLGRLVGKVLGFLLDRHFSQDAQ